jgi:dipeptidase D
LPLFIKNILNVEYIASVNTTLGADDGIGVSMALSIATDKSIEHGPMELLFTIEEEVGLKGSLNLQKDFVKGEILINIDTAQEGLLTTGCSGGIF